MSARGSAPISVAMIGYGIYGRGEHLPALRASPSFNLKAVFSRTRKALEAVTDLDRYSEDTLGSRYDDLLARKDIEAFVIALPIPVQIEYVVKALRAGKHVLAEKPIAEDMNTAQELLSWCRRSVNPARIHFGVAENFRFQPPTVSAAEEVAKLGRIRSFSVKVHNMVTQDSVFYAGSEWRQNPTYQGGYLLEGGVHHIAVLRRVIGPERMAFVTARVGQRQPHLRPIDTVDGEIRCDSGVTGKFSLSVGSETYARDYVVECEFGNVVVGPGENGIGVTVQHVDKQGRTYDTAVYEFPWGSAVPVELEAFAEGIRTGKMDPRLSPYEALRDLEVIEALLVSGAEKGVQIRLSENLQVGDQNGSPSQRARGDNEPLSPHVWQMS